MSKFTKIIKKALTQLNEVNADGTETSGPYNGGVPVTSDNGDNSENKSSSEGVTDPNNPLHTAFDKIKENPDNPTLSDDEHEALQGLAKSLDAAKNNSQTESPEEEKQSNESGGQQENTIVSGSETYKSSTPGITG
jgi:hypothetical protein